MRTTVIALTVAVLGIVGCGKDKPQAGPVEGTVVKSEMSIDEQIAAIQADRNIPEEYKQTYINSLRAKAAEQGQGTPK